MIDYNNVTLVGRLGKDPVLFSTKNGKSLARFSVATARRTKITDENGESYGKETLWHEVVAWGQVAENCNRYLKKGSGVFVNGELRPKVREVNGQKKFSCEISADQVIFLPGGKKTVALTETDVAPTGTE